MVTCYLYLLSFRDPQDKRIMILWNTGKYLPKNTAKHCIWLESINVMFVVCFIHKTQIIWVCQLKISHFLNTKEATVVYIRHIVQLALKFSFTELFLKFTWQLQKHYSYFSENRNFFTLHSGGKMYSNFKHAFSKCFLIQLCTHQSPYCKYQPIS
jgi:hypothetical protein